MNIFKHRQTGASLMEVMIAMSISLVVTASMIALMSNSLGTTARIVKMTKLTDDLRVAMQMMTRDVRRSSYNANSMLCFANDQCATDGTAKVVSADLTLSGNIVFDDLDGNGVFDCFLFLTDRDHDGNSVADDAGGFRRVPPVGPDDAGVIEMWVGDDEVTVNTCEDFETANWVPITNPDNMDVFDFAVTDLSYSEVIQTDAAGVALLSQIIRRVQISLQGRLVMDPNIQRGMADVISVRNDLLKTAGPS